MSTAQLKASKRTELGTRKVKHLRQAGKMPAVLYGHGKEAIALTIEQHDIELALQHGERVLEVDIDGDTQNVMIKDVQYDHLGDHVLHIDLTRVNLDERVEVTVPIVLVGTPEGAKAGGVLRQVTAEVNLEVSVRHMPEDFKLIVSEMQLDDRKTLAELELPEGAKLLDEAQTLICDVSELAEEVEVEAVEGEEQAEPEVIGEKPAEDEEETK